MDKKILEKEKKKLIETLKKVRSASMSLDDKLEGVGKENLNRLIELRENPETSGLDFFMFLEQIHQENLSFNLKDKFQRLEELNYLAKDPYFARIDLKDGESGEINKVYIGKFGYSEKLPIVTDWRAKIASVYYRYRYPQKNVKYQTPDGEIRSDLKLKRTFEIDDGSLVRYYNNDLQLDETEIISEKIGQRTGGVLEDIVETIQESQLDIIEADPRNACIVQGCVGSGKSTVAIHKLSHIFFNYPNLINPKYSLLVAKSQVLIGYLSTLFPKLGIFDLNYKTLKELVINILFREGLKLDVDLNNDDIGIFSVKDVDVLEKEVTNLHIKIEEKIKELFLKEEYEAFSSYKYSDAITPFQNITEIITDLEEELTMQQEEVKENPKSIRALLHKENIKVLKKIITCLKKLRIDLKNKDFNSSLKIVGINLKDKLRYRDLLAYLYLYFKIIGLQKFSKYEYCVVDEGQDFSLLEYMVLKELIIFGRLCVLGDLNQGYTHGGLKDWEDFRTSILKNKNHSLYTLETNYRNTKPIINLANSILRPYTDTYLPGSIERAGPKPDFISFQNTKELLERFENGIGPDSKALDKSVGVICFNEELFIEAGKIIKNTGLEKDRIIELREDKRINYIPKGVYYTMFENCKGLEFSKVYLLGLDPYAAENINDAKKAFIAVTRAMNELNVYYVK